MCFPLSALSLVRNIEVKQVRRLTHDEAEAEALRLARELIADSPSEQYVLTATHAAPCSIDPRPMGKRPSRWIVGTDIQSADSPNTVIDGAPMIVVDLAAGTASWAEI